MKCSDCEFEVDRLKDGLCKDCLHRKAIAKYRHTEYIKIKDLKGTSRYDMIVERRKKRGIFLSKDADAVVEVQQKEKNKKEFDFEKAKNVVNDDIEDRIKKLNINKDEIQMPLDFVLQSFIQIFNKSIITNKTLLKNEYEVGIVDRLHRLRYSDDINEITEIGLEQKYLEEKRCQLKEELSLYSAFKELVEELTKDEIFQTKFKIAIENYEKIKKSYKEYKYQTNMLSMQDLDFTIKGKTEVIERKLAERQPQKKYYVSVPCYNLYGNPAKTLFEAKDGIIAENEEVAKERLKQILKQFKGVFYNEKDILVKEFEKNENVLQN